jgi:hypothetical protein
MAKFSDAIVNSKVFPVSKELPKELKEKIEMFKKRAPGASKEEKKEDKKEETEKKAEK